MPSIAMPEPSGRPSLPFDPQRMRIYPLIVLAVCAIAAILLIATSTDMVDRDGKPLGYDFIAFWGTSDLTLEGRPAAAFDPLEQSAAQERAVNGVTTVFYWHYPPTYQLLTAPVSLLPYAAAFIVFSILGFATYLFGLRPLLRQPHPGLLLAAFPAALLCAFNGQNSLFTAGLFGSAVWLSERGPRDQWLAGVCIGLMSYKPQLGVLIPLALIIAGQWRIFAAATLTTAALAGAATLILGADLWRSFLDNLPLVQTLVESGALDWDKMPSAFIFLRTWSVPQSIAYIAHIALALSVAATTLFIWRKCGMSRPAWAVLVTAALLIPHYMFDYELALLAIPIAILFSDMAERGASRAEKLTLLALILLSGVSATLSEQLHTQIGFVLLIAVFGMTARRALATTNALVSPRLGIRNPISFLSATRR